MSTMINKVVIVFGTKILNLFEILLNYFFIVVYNNILDLVGPWVIECSSSL
jgi:hypothetical protein